MYTDHVKTREKDRLKKKNKKTPGGILHCYPSEQQMGYSRKSESLSRLTRMQH